MVRWFRSAICVGAFLVPGALAWPQAPLIASLSPDELFKRDKTVYLGDLRFYGLRRIAPQTVSAQIASHSGDPLDPEKIDRDVRALARLGWFESIRVEQMDLPAPVLSSSENRKRCALIFHLEERPFLTKVEYSGSRLLSRQQIEKFLEEKKLKPGLGKPADPVQLQGIAAALRSSLNQLGHPEARVHVLREEAPNATVSVRIEINDGPHLPVRQVRFDGHPELPAKLLRAQMQNIAPWKPFSSLRGKDAYTAEAFETDCHQLLEYFQNHGYPEARIGKPQVSRISETSRRWLPWPHQIARAGLSLSIPVLAGPFYRFESFLPSPALQKVANHSSKSSRAVTDLEASKPYSAGEVDKLQRWWQARLQPTNSKSISSRYSAVEVQQSFDAENHTARVRLDLSDTPPYIVQRIEFLGLHPFSDRYVRSKIPLREGQPVNDRSLEAGLARLARTGYFRQIHKEDIHIHLDESNRTASINITSKKLAASAPHWSVEAGNSAIPSASSTPSSIS